MDNTTAITDLLRRIQEEGGFVIFRLDKKKNYFIQFSASFGDKTLYGEAVNIFEGEYSLGSNQIERLKLLGWQDDIKNSNYYRYWEARDDADRLSIAQTIMQTFIEVYGMSPEQPITVELCLDETNETEELVLAGINETKDNEDMQNKPINQTEKNNFDQLDELRKQLVEFENRILPICQRKEAALIGDVRGVINTFIDSFLDTVYKGAISSFLLTIRQLPDEEFAKIKYISDKWDASTQTEKIDDQRFLSFRNDLEEFTAANPDFSDDGLTFVWLFDERLWIHNFKPLADGAKALFAKLQNILDSKANMGLTANELNYFHKAEEIIKKHSATLKRKHSQLMRNDDYGIVDAQKWEEEMLYFYKHVLIPAIGANNYSKAFIEAVGLLLASVTNDVSPQTSSEQLTKSITELTPIEFEAHCSEVLRNQGWTTKLTKSTGDQGVDIVAERNGITMVIQCKLYNSPVGNKAVQEVHAGKDFFKADLGIVVSNAEFTTSAKQLAASLKVILLHHKELEDLDRALIINTQRR